MLPVELREKLSKLSVKEIESIQAGEKITVNGFEFGPEDIDIVTKIKAESLADYQELAGQNDLFVLLDLRQDDEMRQKGITREVINRVQRLRKKANLSPEDNITICIDLPSQSSLIKEALTAQKNFLQQSIKKPVELRAVDTTTASIAEDKFDVDGEEFTVIIVRN